MENITLIFALLIGAAFGYLLHRVGATNAESVIKMLRWQDLRLLRYFMLTVAIGIITLSFFSASGVEANIALAPLAIWAVVGGGLIFGAGLAITGYTPGTALCAIVEGKKDAIFTVIGGLVGACLFGFAYPTLAPFLNSWTLEVTAWEQVFSLPAVTLSTLFAVVLGVWAFRVEDEKGNAEIVTLPKNRKTKKAS